MKNGQSKWAQKTGEFPLQIQEEDRQREDLIEESCDEDAFDGPKPEGSGGQHDHSRHLRADDEKSRVADVLQGCTNLLDHARGQSEQHQKTEQDREGAEGVRTKEGLQNLRVERQSDKRNPAGNKVVDENVEGDLAPALRKSRDEIERCHADTESSYVGGRRYEEECLLVNAIFGLGH